MSEPLFTPASTTSVPQESPAMMRLRIGNVWRVGTVVMGNSEITAPPVRMIARARSRFSTG